MSRSLAVVMGVALLSACWQDPPLGCGARRSETAPAHGVSEAHAEPAAPDAPDRSRIWSVEVEPDGGEFRLVRGAHVDAVRSDLAEIVRAFNQVMALEIGEDGPGVDDPRPPTLRLRGVSDGVARVEIDHAAHLTQRMGTAGARNYLAAATFSLTEAPGVRAVDFQFEEGDHAAPGRYTRQSFEEFRAGP